VSRPKRLEVFRSNLPLLCDLHVESPAAVPLLTWPSLTIDFLHGRSRPRQDLEGWVDHLLVLGTLCEGQVPDSLLLLNVALPCTNPHGPGLAEGAEMRPPRPYRAMEVVACMPHPGGSVLRARSMPQRGSIVATKGGGSDGGSGSGGGSCIHIYDLKQEVEEVAPGADAMVLGEGPLLTCRCATSL
jgi:hypothetical protein